MLRPAEVVIREAIEELDPEGHPDPELDALRGHGIVLDTRPDIGRHIVVLGSALATFAALIGGIEAARLLLAHFGNHPRVDMFVEVVVGSVFSGSTLWILFLAVIQIRYIEERFTTMHNWLYGRFLPTEWEPTITKLRPN